MNTKAFIFSILFFCITAVAQDGPPPDSLKGVVTKENAEVAKSMQDQFLTKLYQYLEKGEKLADRSADFAAQQIPDVINQWILAIRIHYTIIVAFCLCWGYWSFRQAKKCWQHTFFDKNGPTQYFIGWICSMLSLLIPSLVLLTSVKTIIFVFFAPKIYIIQEIGQLIKYYR